MSVYKRDKLKDVKKCIRSILTQSYESFDFYIQFDGILPLECDSYLNSIEDDRIIIRKRNINKGLAYSLNELLFIALGKQYKYIARMDADDICVFDRFEKQILFLDMNTSIDILGGSIIEMDECEKEIGTIAYPIEHESMRLFFGKRNPIAHVSVMFRTTYFEKAGNYPTNTESDEDTMFWLKGFLNGCTFANIEDVLVYVRVGSSFYKRRNRFRQNYLEFRNRVTIIRKLDLPLTNYIWAMGRFVILGLSFSGLTRIAYTYLRKNPTQ